MHISMIPDPDACIRDAYIHGPFSLTLMHVSMIGVR